MGWLLEEHHHIWSFAVTVAQRTSAEGQRRLSGQKNVVFSEQQTMAADLAMLADAEAVATSLRTSDFDVTSNLYTKKQAFLIAVKPTNPLSRDPEKAAARARKLLAEELPLPGARIRSPPTSVLESRSSEGASDSIQSAAPSSMYHSDPDPGRRIVHVEANRS